MINTYNDRPDHAHSVSTLDIQRKDIPNIQEHLEKL